MNYMKSWVVIKVIWNISMVAAAIITTLVCLNRMELSSTFYMVAIEFIVWFMVNEILQLFMPVPVPANIRRN